MPYSQTHLRRLGSRCLSLVLLTSPLLVVACDDLTLSMGEAALTIYGDEGGADFGSVLEVGTGLMDQGSLDLLIGAPLRRGPSGEERAGSVYIFRDPSPGVMEAGLADVVIRGEVGQGYFGGAMSLCDLNGDGIKDLVVGAPSKHRVYIFEGPLPTGTLSASEANSVLQGPANSAAGLSLACIKEGGGDLGVTLAIGAPERSERDGAVYIVSWGDLEPGEVSLEFLGRVIPGEASRRARFGYALAALGDSTGDGVDDLLVGAPDYSQSVSSLEGAAYLFSMDALPFEAGAGAGVRFLGEDSPDGAGFSVSSPGDVNGDGFQDMLIGAPGSDQGGNNAGAAYLIYGRPGLEGDISLSWSAALIVGELKDDFAGAALGGGDFNGDGFDDLLVGAPNHIVGSETVGSGYLVYGPAYERYELELAQVKFEGESQGDRAGTAIAAPLSFFGDLRPEAVIGAPGANDGDRLAVGLVSVFGAGGVEEGSTPEP